MRGSSTQGGRERAMKILFACTVTMAMLVAGVASVGVVGETAEARGPAYDGPQTQSSGPAYFGPAPNPYPYCDSPTYFDPFPENVNPIGRMDVGDTASVTTDGVTMNLEIIAEGNPGTQYPGFFPEGGDGGSNDQPKGIELAEGDTAQVTLSEPLFYSQWIFTDVDQPNEGFTVTPAWTVPGQAAVFAGDTEWTFAGTTNFAVELDDLNGESEVSQSINGRGQVDFLGAVTGITMQRTFPSNGQSGFAVGGGCEAAGAAKAVVAGPTWNGTGFDVTFELRVRNNLPDSDTIQSVIDDAIGGVGASLVTGTPEGIDLSNLQLTDDLRDSAFSAIEVTELSTLDSLTLNSNFDGVSDFDIIAGGAVGAEDNAVITLSVEYTPDLSQAEWDECATGVDYLNQTEVTAQAANVVVSDLSDDGFSASPSDNNGAGGVDDPTPVSFPCPPGDLEIVKTVLPGPNATCPDFDGGVPGDGPALDVTVDDVVTYCVSVRNPGPGPVSNVIVSDAQAPGDISLPDLGANEQATTSYDVQVDLSTPPLNTAVATGDDVDGPVGPVQDTALIQVSPKDQPDLEIVKTVIPGPNGTCPSIDDGVAGLGPALLVDDGDTVTYCVSVRNNGLGDATNVVISDPQAPQDYAVGTLGTNDSATESYDITVDLTTPTVNTATANYEGPDGPRDPVSDPAQIEVAPLQPELEIVKTVLPGANATCPAFDDGIQGLGPALVVDDRDTVTYCVSVRNIGRGEATDVVIDDTQAPSQFNIGDLAPGAGVTVDYNVTVTLATPPINTATANGDGPDGPLDPVDDQAQIAVEALPDPILEIVKTAIAGPNGLCPDFDAGTPDLGAAVRFVETDVVTYCVSIRNSGVGPATDVTVSDPQAPNTFDLNIGDLAPGQEVTRSYDLVVDLDTETVNVATTQGQGLNGPVGPVSDPALIEVNLQPDPVLEIVKTVVPGPNGDCPATFDEGVLGDGPALPVLYDDVVTYCITVRNTGDNDATTVTVADDQAPGVLQLGTVPVGEEVSDSYDVDVDATTPALNTATVNGIGPNGAVPSDSDTALIDPAPQPDPILQIVKTVVLGPNGDCPANFDAGVPGDGDALTVALGDTVTYCVTVRNVGERDATNVVIEDAQADAPIDIGTLAVDAEASTSYDVEVDAETPMVNTATATGVGPNGPVGPVSDTAVIAPGDPVLEIVKTVVRGPNGDCPPFEGGVVGEGDPLGVQYTDTVTYCISITNSGANTATAVVIADPQAPGGSFDIGTVPVGAFRTRSYDVIITEDTPTLNVATATGEGPNGKPVGPVSDPAVIDPSPQPEPILEIVKTVVLGPDGSCPSFADGVDGPGDPLTVAEGQTVTYCVAIQNSGPGDAENVEISDDQLPTSPILIGSLPSGEGRLVQYDLVVTPNIGVRNVAVVTGTGPTGPVPPDDDDALIDTLTANISLIHSVSKADEDCVTVAKNLNSLVANREELPVTWCALVTNNGTVPLTDVVLTAPDVGDGEPIDVLEGTGVDVLLPGESVVVPFDGVIPDTGLISNAEVEAVASDENGNPLDGVPNPSDDDNAEVREASINIETTVAAGADADCADAVEVLLIPVDEDITWCFEVTNTGAVDLLVTRVTDPELGITAPVPPELQRMGPNVTILLSANGISADDLVIDADVRGKPLDFDGTILDQAPEVEDIDPAQVIVPEADVAIVKTISNPGPVAIGQTVTYTLEITNNGPERAEGVMVTDRLPTGISYVSLPDDADWACALDADEAGFSCLKGTNLAAGEVVTLTYAARINQSAPANSALTNTATVTSETPDTDPTNNEDTSTTITPEPDEVIPTVEQPEYPGPFTPPPPLTLPEPDEVLGLALTGASSSLLGLVGAAMVALGGLLTVGARRSRDDE